MTTKKLRRKAPRGGTPRDNAQAALALADWARTHFSTHTAAQVADTHRITTRTLWRWKAALDTNEQLSAAFHDAVEQHLRGDWSDALNDALHELITRMVALARQSGKLTEVTEAFRALADTATEREMLRAIVQQGDAATAPHAEHAAGPGHHPPRPVN